jgi:RNA polymerase sigma factor (sigma-70 family)
MSGPAWNTILRHCRGLVGPPDGGQTDAQLLSRWLASRDEAAFELIVWRHGPTVRGVCQRLLRRPQDVEDAFQATFLVLIQKAGTIGKREAVASWLYKVAYRVALRARQRSPREAPLDGRGVHIPAPPAPDAAAWRDFRVVLDEEVCRLPGRYRSAFVLRFLRGMTDAEAARELGVPTGTVQSRLSRARARLRERLTRRGVTLTAGALAAGCAAEASAGLPASLVRSIVTAALSGAADRAAAAGVVTAQAAALAKGAIRAMWMTKVQMTAALVLSVALIGGGAFTYRALAAGPGDEPGPASRSEGPARQADKGKAQDVKASTDAAKAREDALRAEVQSLRDQLEKYKDDNARLNRQVRELENRLDAAGKASGSPSGAPGTGGVGGRTTTPPPRDARETSPLAELDVAQAAKDAVDILQVQVQAKKAELQAAMIDLKAAQRHLSRLKALGKANAVASEEVSDAEDKVARCETVVQVKEAELHEQQLRLDQASRRLERARPAREATKPAPRATDQQQLQELRKELEQLMRKVESLEKSGAPPGRGATRP